MANQESRIETDYFVCHGYILGYIEQHIILSLSSFILFKAVHFGRFNKTNVSIIDQ